MFEVTSVDFKDNWTKYRGNSRGFRAFFLRDLARFQELTAGTALWHKGYNLLLSDLSRFTQNSCWDERWPKWKRNYYHLLKKKNIDVLFQNVQNHISLIFLSQHNFKLSSVVTFLWRFSFLQGVQVGFVFRPFLEVGRFFVVNISPETASLKCFGGNNAWWCWCTSSKHSPKWR